MSQEVTRSVTTIIFKDDNVLLVRNGVSSDHPTGKYGLPAGKVDEGETWEEAATRECEEESGLRPKRLVRLPTFYEADLERKDGKKHFVCWSFYCPEYEGELRTTDETEPVWIKVNKIKELDLVVNVDKMIAEAEIERKRTASGPRSPTPRLRQTKGNFVDHGGLGPPSLQCECSALPDKLMAH